MRFPLANGKVVPEGGEYIDHKETKMRVKYKDEMHFALSVAQIKQDDGTIEGRRCPIIDQTRKVIVSAKEEN